jgi:phage shock protein B
MDDIVIPIGVCSILFIGLPWLIFHYVTQWKKAGTLTSEDEQLLDGLHETARRLDERMQTIERIMTAENPGWRSLSADPTSIGIEDRNYQGTRRIDQ